VYFSLSMMPISASGSLKTSTSSLIFQVCGKVEIGEEAVREAVELRPDIAILELAAADDLQVANAFKQHIPSVPLLLVAEEVSPETEKGPGAWCGCSVPKGRRPDGTHPECSGAL